jgi:hypothetical protein
MGFGQLTPNRNTSNIMNRLIERIIAARGAVIHAGQRQDGLAAGISGRISLNRHRRSNETQNASSSSGIQRAMARRLKKA